MSAVEEEWAGEDQEFGLDHVKLEMPLPIQVEWLSRWLVTSQGLRWSLTGSTWRSLDWS